MVAAELDQDEPDRGGDADDESDDGDGGRPALFGAFLDGEYEAADGEHGQDGAGDVEAGFDVFA